MVIDETPMEGLMKRYIIIAIVLIIALLSVFLLTQCGKNKKSDNLPDSDIFIPKRDKVEAKNEEQTTVEKVIIKTMDQLNINLKSINKLQKEEAIYFYIAIDNEKDLYFVDMVLSGQIEQIGVKEAYSITDNNNKVIREYFDDIHQQSYIIEIYYSHILPGFKPGERKIDVPYLAIIVDDFGNYDNELLDDFADSHPAITFAVIPGLPHSKTAMNKAINKGHEVIVHIPMEPLDPKINPGSNAIFNKMTSAEATAKMNAYFKELPLAVGANQHMGSRVSANNTLMQAVLTVIKNKGMFFIDSKTIGNSVAYNTAVDMNIPSAERDLFLDAPANSDKVLEDRINDLKKLKDTKGKVLVITHCHDRARLDRLNRFIIAAEEMGYELIPASKYVIMEPEIN